MHTYSDNNNEFISEMYMFNNLIAIIAVFLKFPIYHTHTKYKPYYQITTVCPVVGAAKNGFLVGFILYVPS